MPNPSAGCEPGRYRHRATINEPVETTGSQGQTVIASWQAFAKRVPGRVTELAGRELISAQQIAEDVTHQFECRWISGVTGKMALAWHDGATDRTLNIVATPLNPDGRKNKMIILCREPR
jgi:SPP1 family predicted phage head-tail adaptor